MPDNQNNHQVIEPVHVREDQPTASQETSTASVTPSQSEPILNDQAQSKQAASAHQSPQKPHPVKSKTSQKESNKGVTSAILATVVIVLGLAALAVYAYLKTKK
jgi:hypothetical protein